jgi:hypothetical protein
MVWIAGEIFWKLCLLPRHRSLSPLQAQDDIHVLVRGRIDVYASRGEKAL